MARAATRRRRPWRRSTRSGSSIRTWRPSAATSTTSSRRPTRDGSSPPPCNASPPSANTSGTDVTRTHRSKQRGGSLMLLEDKRILVTGITNESSLAFPVARIAQEQGADVVLSSFGRVMSITKKAARRLPIEPDIVELDVSNDDDLEALADRLGGRLDGVVHSIAYAPPSCLGGGFLDAPWEDVATAVHVSTYSYKSLAVASLPLMSRGSGIVGLTFDATMAWPVYDWMGVAKAGLESANRYLALHLGRQGVRSNLVSAGPLRTMAAKSIPGFEQFEDAWAERAPLGWNLTDQEPAARAVLALLSDWFPATTGEVVHVDGGYHAIGATPSA